MNKILIDTMHIESMFGKYHAYLELIDAIDEGTDDWRITNVK